MKRSFLILGAVVLIATAGVMQLGYGWSEDEPTRWNEEDGGWDPGGGSAYAYTGGSATLRVMGPACNHVCDSNDRYAEVRNSPSGTLIGSVFCPPGGGGQTLVCCQRKTWTAQADLFYNYIAHCNCHFQNCGPVNVMICSGIVNCNQN